MCILLLPASDDFNAFFQHSFELFIFVAVLALFENKKLGS